MIDVIQGDCRERMREGVSAQAVVCDPPYGLNFMGKDWDAGVPGVEFWRLALGCVPPGGYLLAFGGTRKWHRLACAIEDAGWELRDTLMWIHGQGFPKNAQVALKPSWEPILMFRKPLGSTVAENVQAHGTGALNVDGCRVMCGRKTPFPQKGYARKQSDSTYCFAGDERFSTRGIDKSPEGRWPANLVLDEAAAAMLDEQSGESFSSGGRALDGSPFNGTGSVARDPGFGDTGGASRFFYCAKASTVERNAGLATGENRHPTVKPVSLMRWLVRLVTPPGGTVFDPFMGSGTTGVACVLEGFDFVGCETDADAVEVARRRIAWAEQNGEQFVEADREAREMAEAGLAQQALFA